MSDKLWLSVKYKNPLLPEKYSGKLWKLGKPSFSYIGMTYFLDGVLWSMGHPRPWQISSNNAYLFFLKVQCTHFTRTNCYRLFEFKAKLLNLTLSGIHLNRTVGVDNRWGIDIIKYYMICKPLIFNHVPSTLWTYPLPTANLSLFYPVLWWTFSSSKD